MPVKQNDAEPWTALKKKKNKNKHGSAERSPPLGLGDGMTPARQLGVTP